MALGKASELLEVCSVWMSLVKQSDLEVNGLIDLRFNPAT